MRGQLVALGVKERLRGLDLPAARPLVNGSRSRSLSHSQQRIRSAFVCFDFVCEINWIFYHELPQIPELNVEVRRTVAVGTSRYFKQRLAACSQRAYAPKQKLSFALQYASLLLDHTTRAP